MTTQSGPGDGRSDPGLSAIMSERRQLINLTYRLLGSAVTVEATGNRDKLDALIRVLEPFGIKELVQSGMVALGSPTPKTNRPSHSGSVDSLARFWPAPGHASRLILGARRWPPARRTPPASAGYSPAMVICAGWSMVNRCRIVAACPPPSESSQVSSPRSFCPAGFGLVSRSRTLISPLVDTGMWS